MDCFAMKRVKWRAKKPFQCQKMVGEQWFAGWWGIFNTKQRVHLSVHPSFYRSVFSNFTRNTGKALTFFGFMLEYLRKEKTMGKPNRLITLSEKGNGVSPLCGLPVSHFLRCPGWPGRAAPVTEQLRCRLCGELGWYRVISRPYHTIGAFYFL